MDEKREAGAAKGKGLVAASGGRGRRDATWLYGILGVMLFAAIWAVALSSPTGWHEYTEGESSIRWRVDEVGNLAIEPIPGTEGELNLVSVPWEGRSDIKSFKVTPGKGVRCTGSLREMFFGCRHLESVDLTGLDTSSVTDMNGMFSGCSSLESLDLSGLDASSVTNMSDMFSGCSSLASLDLSGLDASSVTDMSWMFYSCPSLREVKLGPGWESVPELPAPTGDGHTGRWVRVDDDGTPVGDAYTPEGLLDAGLPSYEGTWAWERA